jgi:transposase-like protein
MMTLQLFGLIRYACASCRRTFAVGNDAKPASSVPPAGVSS